MFSPCWFKSLFQSSRGYVLLDSVVFLSTSLLPSLIIFPFSPPVSREQIRGKLLRPGTERGSPPELRGSTAPAWMSRERGCHHRGQESETPGQRPVLMYPRSLASHVHELIFTLSPTHNQRLSPHGPRWGARMRECIPKRCSQGNRLRRHCNIPLTHRVEGRGAWQEELSRRRLG